MGDDRRHEPPGRWQGLLAGRSQADRDVEVDAGRRAVIFGVCAMGVMLLLATDAFKALGLSFGLWALPAFIGVVGWAVSCRRAGRALRPRQIAGLRGRQRAAAVAVELLALRLVWPLWAGPAAAAWQPAQEGFSESAPAPPSFPYGAVLAAAPVAMGIVAFVLVVLAMTLTPMRSKRGYEPLQPDGEGDSLRVELLTDRASRDCVGDRGRAR
jgi:hypothetical protein